MGVTVGETEGVVVPTMQTSMLTQSSSSLLLSLL